MELKNQSSDKDEAYRVLARKYRPTNFDELIGQDALVRTLSNGIETGRIAQAFMLTGVRGVGKTTTARIIAKALNCIGPDGQGGPTISPCGICDNCTAITEDRHVDVMEMDAATRTSVDDIRELIESVRYLPMSARYKVYILDEVHMLSKNAGNALLKTLEEPPKHVKFIFATTDIRKVLVTVLSRCQRFDLRLVPIDKLKAHYQNIAKQENVTIDSDALSMVSRAADGSVRDGLSILDQAIAMAGQTVTGEQIRDMLGLADRTQIFDLFDAVMTGDVKVALGQLRILYDAGTDPIVIIQDLMDVCHWLTRLKLTPSLAENPLTPEIERIKGKEMAEQLSLPIFTRAWQMLLKGLEETKVAPAPIQAAEMVVIRLIHASDIPTPEDIVKKFKEGNAKLKATPEPAVATPSPVTPSSSMTQAMPPYPVEDNTTPTEAQAQANATIIEHEAQHEAIPESDIQAVFAENTHVENIHMDTDTAPTINDKSAKELPQVNNFRDIVKLMSGRREGALVKNLTMDVHLVKFEQGLIEFRAGKNAPSDLSNKLAKLLSDWTGKRWMVSLSNETGDATIDEQDTAIEKDKIDGAGSDPLVKAVIVAFPTAQIKKVIMREESFEGLPQTGVALADMD